MKTEFASSKYTAGQLNAIIKKLKDQLGENGPNLLLKDRLKIRAVGSTDSKVFEWLGTTNIPATRKKFIVKEKFINDSLEVNFFGVWDSFFNYFIAGGGKVEDPHKKQEIRYGNLKKGFPDEVIIKELGGKEKAEMTLSEVFSLLKKQENGEAGLLLTNGYANIFYVKDDCDVLRAVVAHRRDKGWGMDAYDVENPAIWPVGRRVFCRNS